MSIARLSFSYPAEQKQELLKIADFERRSLSSLIQIFIEEGIERRRQTGVVPKTVAEKVAKKAKPAAKTATKKAPRRVKKA